MSKSHVYSYRNYKTNYTLFFLLFWLSDSLMLPICFAMLVPLLLSLELYSLLSLFQRLLSFKSQIRISRLCLYYKQNQLLNKAFFSFKNKYYFSNKFLILVCVLTWVLGEMTLLKLVFLAMSWRIKFGCFASNAQWYLTMTHSVTSWADT